MLSVKDLCVNYSYKTVLNGVSLSFEKAKIYALLGENGAGKSTLAKVLCGDLKPTSGQLFLNDCPLSFSNPHAAIEKGIVCVHQRPLLSSSISIHENLLLGQKKFDRNDEKALLAQWLPQKNSRTLVKDISIEETFYVSLVGALLRKPAFLILDEPPSIPAKKLRALTESGMTLLIITHSLSQAMEKSDKIVLLQDGNVLEEKNTNEFTETEISQKLFGISKEVKLPPFIKTQKISENEVLCLRKHNSKIGYIPSDKTFRASNPNLTILQLTTAYHTDKHKAALEAYAKKILQKAEVNIRLNEKASCLSGGMLQRLILEREIAQHPSKLYLFNPTKGLDVEGTERFYSKLEELSNSGTECILGREPSTVAVKTSLEAGA